jgi:YfiH family protein
VSATSSPESTPSARHVAEPLRSSDVPLWVHPEWAESLPWLLQGTTGAGDGGEPFDLGLSGAQPVGKVMERWRLLRRETGVETVVHARQVHRADLFVHRVRGIPGIAVMDGVDGHVSDVSGLLLTVSVADCVPVSIVDPERRAVALVHAGWRGVAGGIVEAAIGLLGDGFGSSPGSLLLHCGPSICGRCYEVGPEVHAGVRPNDAPPAGPTCIDLRAAIAKRAAAVGVSADGITLSTHCTRCGPGAFFSHRGGSPARQMGILGIR